MTARCGVLRKAVKGTALVRLLCQFSISARPRSCDLQPVGSLELEDVDSVCVICQMFVHYLCCQKMPECFCSTVLPYVASLQRVVAILTGCLVHFTKKGWGAAVGFVHKAFSRLY